MNEPILNATDAECGFLDDRIVEYNNTKVPFTQSPSFISINRVIKNAEGEVVAGLISVVYSWKCLHIDVLWVREDCRGKGYGALLLHEVEAIAKNMGSHIAHLDTFDFQAKDFYLKQGYSTFGEMADCPEAHRRYYMSKVLS